MMRRIMAAGALVALAPVVHAAEATRAPFGTLPDRRDQQLLLAPGQTDTNRILFPCSTRP